jgi:hypothetical protein
MPNRQTLLDEVANDLALWIEQTADEIARAFTPQGVSPFAAQLTEQQKLEYYRAQLFNPDGSPNEPGRSAQIQRLGAEGFARLYKQVVSVYPELRPPQTMLPLAPPTPQPALPAGPPPGPLPGVPAGGP